MQYQFHHSRDNQYERQRKADAEQDEVAWLALGEVALAFCGAASPANQKLMDGLLEADAETGFARGWLELKQLGWAADLLAGQPNATLSQIAAE